MNSKIANLLANNLGNKKIVAEMIMYICIKNNALEDSLIDLCLSTDDKFITKDILSKYMDKIKTLCMKYIRNAVDVYNIKINYINNIAGLIDIEFTARVEAWFTDKESADKGDSWCSNSKEDNEHKVKGTYVTRRNTYIDFKDLDLD